MVVPEENVLTEDQVDSIVEASNEAVKESESLTLLKDLNEGNIDTKSEVESGVPEGEATVGSTPPNNPDEEVDYLGGKSFEELVKEAEDNLATKIGNDHPELDIDDIKEEIEKNVDVFRGMKFTDEEMQKFLDIVKRYQNKEKFNFYRELPDRIKTVFDNNLKSLGVNNYSVMSNTARNSYAEILMDEFISNMNMNKYVKDFNNQLESLQSQLGDTINKEFSKAYSDYAKNREEYISNLLKDETDEKKREAMGKIIDAVHEGYSLTGVIELAGKYRIKKYELENCKRAFDIIENKYRNSKFNIYSIELARNILARHMKDEYSTEDITKFFIVLCKYCANMSPNNPVDHAFMYHAIYDPILLDVYRDEDYTKFSEGYFESVRKVMNKIKERENKSNENK